MKFTMRKSTIADVAIFRLISNLAEKFDVIAEQSSLFFNRGVKLNDTQKESLENSIKVITTELEKIKGIFLTQI